MVKRFTKQFGGLLKKYKNELELSQNYVDNFLEVLASLKPGVGFWKEEGKIERKEKWVDENNEMADDVGTMKQLQEIANSVFPSM